MVGAGAPRRVSTKSCDGVFGKVSTKVGTVVVPVRGKLLGLVIVIVTVERRPPGIVLGAKDLLRVAGAKLLTSNVALVESRFSPALVNKAPLGMVSV